MVTIVTMLSVAIEHGCHGYKVYYEHVMCIYMMGKKKTHHVLFMTA